MAGFRNLVGRQSGSPSRRGGRIGHMGPAQAGQPPRIRHTGDIGFQEEGRSTPCYARDSETAGAASIAATLIVECLSAAFGVWCRLSVCNHGFQCGLWAAFSAAERLALTMKALG